ncbi:MAG: phytoene dehydrogenase, partial [Candidatus Accumulibacter phosphatis]|nr:phytoene dehydrogenase [Candidatus Accumulibacter phosphatis]
EWQQVIREQRATFSCRPDLHRPAARTARSGLWLAGDYVCADYPATLEAAVRSGLAAARGMLLESRS